MFLQQFINGLTPGSVYALIALGYNVVYGILELINFGNGESNFKMGRLYFVDSGLYSCME
jgi:branched-chain amino acid transport system permease protein